MKTVLILGAGIGGVDIARKLSIHSGNEDNIHLIKIIVFEKEDKSVFSPSLPWLMVGNRKADQIYKSTKKIEASGLEVVNGEIEKVDPENISVTVKGKAYKGDYMVVSLGVEQKVKYNLDKYGFNFFQLKGAEGFHEGLKKFTGGKIAVLISSLPYKSPAAPYEAAMLIEDYISKNGLRDKTEISIYTPEKRPMEFAGKDSSNELLALLGEKGIKYFPSHQITSATTNSLEFDNSDNHNFDLLAFTPEHLSPAVIRKSVLAGKSGWIEVNGQTMETAYPHVYAIGDNVDLSLESGIPLPKLGIFARSQAKIVAHNIGRNIKNKESDRTFSAEGEYFIESGEGKAMPAKGHFDTSSKAKVDLKIPDHWGHISKWWSEKYWLFKNF
ncbi:FAD/NAD(P)-binding oxidoreductase [Gramella sp. AN32]|uniref:NAD(P)/FAD-dependent oxidoreductase n=1 Tax=Christiangramia antarctica TaxID=2058158 RepID=A0ABW5X7D1_9FLAO|nr:FAD/NAD(P)-binding oxidoreductase [Gramella sp. AN32]MCM4158137.1 NAD(P)/FAD-dependent oxidoreductase [Gramella sp. AN32]